MNWRSKTEKKFEVFSDWLYDNSTKTIFIVLLFVGAIGTQLPALKMDTSTEGFLHKSDPMRIEYDLFRNQFGRDEQLIIAVKTNNRTISIVFAEFSYNQSENTSNFFSVLDLQFILTAFIAFQ